MFIAVCALLLTGCNADKESDRSDRSDTPTRSTENTIYSVTTVSEAGGLHGKIVWTGERPAPVSFTVTEDCTPARRYNRLEIGPGNGVRDAVVLVTGITRGKPFPDNTHRWLIHQQGCQYVPHASVIPVGSGAVVINDENMPHNVRIEDTAKDSLLLNKTQPGRNRSDTFLIPYTGYFGISCDYHPWMNGHVVGVDNPYFAITDSAGAFLIEGIPAGTYKVRVIFNGIGVMPLKDNTGKIIRYRFDNPMEQEFPVQIAKSVQTPLNLRLTLKGIETVQ